MLDTHFSCEEDQSVNMSRNFKLPDLKNLSLSIDFDKIIMEQELCFSKTEVKSSRIFLGEEDDESTEIDSILSFMKNEESLFTLKYSQQSECEEILGILKPSRYSEPLKGFSKSTPEFYKHSAKRISLQGKVIQNDNNKKLEKCQNAFLPQVLPENYLKDECPPRLALVRPRARGVPERVSNPFMKNFITDCSNIL
jgi:hypothetical protein